MKRIYEVERQKQASFIKKLRILVHMLDDMSLCFFEGRGQDSFYNGIKSLFSFYNGIKSLLLRFPLAQVCVCF